MVTGPYFTGHEEIEEANRPIKVYANAARKVVWISRLVEELGTSIVPFYRFHSVRTGLVDTISADVVSRN
jgi:hypothetical protein